MVLLFTILFSFIFTTLSYSQDAYRIEINRLKMPLNKTGVLANVNINGTDGGWYDESTLLFSGGFFLSGKSGDSLWANAVASASRIEDYLAGNIGSDPNDPLNRLYIIEASDPPFGESWQNWSDAVSLGADFYDGDGDGFYNPVDLNGNGVWDLSEDRPDILGDVTVWCVYNDGRERQLRRFQVDPQGIEIHQTVFAVGNNLIGPAENMIFIRYRILNRGTVVTQMDSVYFTTWADADIGSEGYTDDLVGSDTLLNAGFTYNDGDDPSYGSDPPAIFLAYLQGPAVYIPGITFIDNNSNGVYDPGIDTPLDTAFVNNGLFIGSETLPGAKNLDMSSFVHYIASHPTQGDPNTHIEARNYMLGFDKFGNFINPCSWTFGHVVGIPCNQINPVFMYSGDPVTNYGWINIGPTDQRMMVNTGPFELKANEPVDIWVGYIVGRGSDALNSITVGKEHVQYAHQYYKNNFFILPVDVDDEILLNDFYLSQNYPNPFNPITKIKFTIPTGVILSGAKNLFVTMRVYDILGREVATLVNEEKPAGSYEVTFDASQFASGVYLYRLEAGSFSSNKKMILLK